MAQVFGRADILFPQVEDMKKWAVIACDQFTSQPEYWEAVETEVGEAPSTLNLVFPESYLGQDEAARIQSINQTMEEYVNREIFKQYPDSYIYVERTLLDGKIRKGIIGNIELDTYDYTNGATSAIRATERTVIERIPPRKRIREHASLELPHVILLCDDDRKALIESVETQKASLPVLYDFDLMQNGGHIVGYLVSGQAAADFDAAKDRYMADTKAKYEKIGEAPMYFAVGDGNHSLATAKSCYEDIKAALQKSGKEVEAANHPARFALVELENLQDEAQQFEPIHRILEMADPVALLNDMKQKICVEDPTKGYAVKWLMAGEKGTIYLDASKGELPVGILQEYLDEYLAANGGNIDYIHGEDALEQLSRKAGHIGFGLPAIEKDHLFMSIVKDGVLPRKTFSMGHATEKRYYLEARAIQ